MNRKFTAAVALLLAVLLALLLAGCARGAGRAPGPQEPPGPQDPPASDPPGAQPPAEPGGPPGEKRPGSDPQGSDPQGPAPPGSKPEPPVASPAPPADGPLPDTFAFTCTPAVSSPVTAVPGPRPVAGWEQVFPLPTGRNLHGVAYGNGRFVAVGDVGTVITSPDGEQWNLVASGQGIGLSSVVFGGGRFIAAGQDGTLYHSTDGLTWTQQSIRGGGELKEIAFGAGRWVIFHGDGRMLTSTDGESWSACIGAAPPLTQLAYEGALFGAFGPGGSKDEPSRVLYTSADGLTWATATRLAAAQVSPTFVYGGGRYLAMAAPQSGASSADGLAWSPVSLTYQFGGGHWGYAGGAFGNDRLLLLADACDPGGCYTNLLTAADGASWESLTVTTNPLTAIAFGGGRFVGVGLHGIILTTDGQERLWQNLTTYMSLTDLAYGNGRFVAMGGWGTLLLSPDGRTWSYPTGARQTPAITSSLSLLYANGLFVAAGAQKHTGWVIYTSPDGSDWNLALNVSMTYQDPTPIRRLLYHEGQYVVELEDGRALISADGTAWTLLSGGYSAPEPSPVTLTIPGERVIAAAQGEGVLVALTEWGVLWASK